jgi:hypothetical protein
MLAECKAWLINGANEYDEPLQLGFRLRSDERKLRGNIELFINDLARHVEKVAQSADWAKAFVPGDTLSVSSVASLFTTDYGQDRLWQLVAGIRSYMREDLADFQADNNALPMELAGDATYLDAIDVITWLMMPVNVLRAQGMAHDDAVVAAALMR